MATDKPDDPLSITQNYTDQTWRTSQRTTPEKARLAFAELAPGEDADLADAKAPSTMLQYCSAWRTFTKWCKAENHVHLPAAPATLKSYVKHMSASGRVASTIEASVAAIATVHRWNGHSIDRTLIIEHLKAARRRGRPPRRARPLRITDSQDVLAMLDPASARDARDAVLLLVGSAGALRSSELCGLDWQRPGPADAGGTGFMGLERDGVLLTLLKSKTSQITSQEIPIPFADCPPLATWLQRWIAHAAIAPGEPIIRPILSSGIVQRARLAPGSITSILKARAIVLAQARGLSEIEARIWADRVTSHALRRGYATSASEAGLDLGRIRKRTRHGNDATLTKYIDSAEGWRTTGLEGLWKAGDT